MLSLRTPEPGPLAAPDALSFSRLRGPLPFHRNMQVMDLLSESVSVQAQQFCCLDLVPFGFLKCPGN
jgi:hypothetical protein